MGSDDRQYRPLADWDERYSDAYLIDESNGERRLVARRLCLATGEASLHAAAREQEFRYDQSWEKLGNGAHLTIYDSGKGLELIPTRSTEVVLNLPAYNQRTAHNPANGQRCEIRSIRWTDLRGCEHHGSLHDRR